MAQRQTKSTPPRALVVEDDRAWQQLLSELLTELGLRVDVADSYPAALRALRSAAYRLAVVDLSLQPLDPHNQEGLRVLEAIRKYNPGCVALLVTGYATVEVTVTALREKGAYSVLRKETFRRSEFRKLVRRALAEPPVEERALTTPTAPPVRLTAVAPAADRPRGLALVVEDDAGWQSILAELLEEAGFIPRLCRSFAEALGRLRRERFAVAVVDLALASSLSPEHNRDGYRLLANTHAAGIPTIVVSGMGSPDEAEAAYREHGIFAYVEKQAFDRRGFLALVEEAVASQAAQSPLNRLTPRERQVLALLVEGKTNKEIAAALVVSPNTVKRHLQAIFEKLGVSTRAAAVAEALRWLEKGTREDEPP